MTDRDDVQGTRTGPLVGSLILLLLSCILIQLSLNSDWASMSGEVEYTKEDRESADYFGYDLPDRSMSVSFGLTDMTVAASNDGEEMEETTKLAEVASESGNSDYLDMDWDDWYSTGKTTSIALWVGFIAAVLGSIMALIGASKANDTAHGGGIILCGLAASLINVGWFNWIIFGGDFADGIPGGDGWTTDGFGVSTGFILCIIAGVFLLIVPFILAWSQELPINKLLPLKGGFSELEMRHYQPSMRLNATIVIMLACLLVFSGVGQGVTSVYFYPDNSQNSAVNQEDDNDDQDNVLIPWITIWPTYDAERVEGLQQTINDGQSTTILFFENADLSPVQAFSIVFDCNDGGNGETGAPNAQDETDILHWTISSNNGQELSGSLDCDDEDEHTDMENEGNDDWVNWYNELDPYLVYHDEDDADSVLETAPINKNMFPISVEFTAETRGDTMEQNQDKELEFTIGPCGDGSCDVMKETLDLEYDTFFASEDAMEHEHYNGSS
ncbi:hypothetical protein OAJ94_04770 [Deltaproteobacteria bacterium]|nr:hypothetical protein [Deltaproteobacteria bacterium]